MDQRNSHGTPPVLEVHAGEGSSTRVVVLLSIVRHFRALGSHLERLFGPWRDRDQAAAELETIAAGCRSGGLVSVEWAAIRSEDVAAAYLQERDSEEPPG